MDPSGHKIVLTADRTLMSEYSGGIFLGFAACLPKGLIPDDIYFSVFCPPVPIEEGGRAALAPNGTRRIETALLAYGFKPEEIVVAHPDHLDEVIGPTTRILGLTETDPLGIGPATSTYSQIFPGETYMHLKFQEALRHPLVQQFRPKVVVGGPGAWQLASEENRQKYKIDHVVIGEGEKVSGPLLASLVRNEPAPAVVYGEEVPATQMPVNQKPSIHGLVEISRGCGRGCQFCLPTTSRPRHRPLADILEEVKINLHAGRQPLLHAEDILGYGGQVIGINKHAVINLFKTLTLQPGIRDISISHVSLSSVIQAPELIQEISSLLGLDEKNWLGPQTGIETGSAKLIRAHMPGKCRPFSYEAWPSLVVDAFNILQENHWVPCGTLVMGLPEEEDADVLQSIALVEKLVNVKSLIVPLFFVAQGRLYGKATSFTVEKMSGLHEELFTLCWEHNLRWRSILFESYADRFIPDKKVREGMDIATRLVVEAMVNRFEG